MGEGVDNKNELGLTSKG